MSNGETIKDWIKAGETSLKHRFDPFFRVAVQARVDDGSAFCVVLHNGTKEAIKGGLKATRTDLERLVQLDLLAEEGK